MWKDVCYLIRETEYLDSKNRSRKIKTKTFAYCNIKSVTGREFYQAGQNGLKAGLMVELRDLDYDEQSKIEYKDREYSVIRPFRPPGKDTVELTCEALLNES